jgi:hypothetical protein
VRHDRADEFRAVLWFTGVEDWRVLWGAGRACACFQAGSFGVGAALVQAISELADHEGNEADLAIWG